MIQNCRSQSTKLWIIRKTKNRKELSYILYNTLSLIKGKYSQKEIADNLKFELQKQIDTLDEILINSEKKGK